MLLTHLWEEGWSGFHLVRLNLFWGPMLMGKMYPPPVSLHHWLLPVENAYYKVESCQMRSNNSITF